jgi:hypothetical protein
MVKDILNNERHNELENAKITLIQSSGSGVDVFRIAIMPYEKAG